MYNDHDHRGEYADDRHTHADHAHYDHTHEVWEISGLQSRFLDRLDGLLDDLQREVDRLGARVEDLATRILNAEMTKWE